MHALVMFKPGHRGHASRKLARLACQGLASVLLSACLAVFAALSTSRAEDFLFKEKFVAAMPGRVHEILRIYDPATGRFDGKVWICTDQNRMYPLAVAYATPGQARYKDPKLLPVIMKAGDALIKAMHPDGSWDFRKKDGSTWGTILSPWVYARWIMSFALIKEDMPAERRVAWEKALTAGFTTIAQKELKEQHNIITFKAMALYQAGLTLGRPEWCAKAADYLMKIVAAQFEGGYWKEGGGPLVVEYNSVYVEALGHYYAMSHDRRVLPALEKAAAYHAHFTYPDARSVETLDQRNPYSPEVPMGNVGFSFSATGRAWLRQQWARGTGLDRNADLMAAMVHHGEEGPAEPLPGEATFILHEDGVAKAATLRRDGWFIALSAFTTPVAKVRWHQDRQNMISIYNDATGLLLGGGNTKLQPAWSTFTVGDTFLLAHKPGDTQPDFLPPEGLFHVPSQAALVEGPEPGLDLVYGPEQCRLRLRSISPRRLACEFETTLHSGLPVAAHLTLLPQLGKALKNGSGQEVTLGKDALAWSAREMAGTLRYDRCALTLPDTATLDWPKLPHNPYVKDGHAGPAEGRVVITLPFDRDHKRQEVVMEVVDDGG